MNTPLSNGTLLHFKLETYIIVEITEKFYHCNLKQRVVKHVGETDVAFDKQHLHNLILTGKVRVE